MKMQMERSPVLTALYMNFAVRRLRYLTFLKWNPTGARQTQNPVAENSSVSIKSLVIAQLATVRETAMLQHLADVQQPAEQSL